MKTAIYTTYILLSFISYGQVQETTNISSFHLENVQNQEFNTLFSARISTGNFETFRLKNTPIELVFEEGFKCVLLPASELTHLGIDSNLYQEKFPDNFLLPLFHFTENGGISAVYSKLGK